MRIMLNPPGFLMAELKWAHKPNYRQPQADEIRFPVGHGYTSRCDCGFQRRPTAASSSGRTGYRLSWPRGKR